MTTGPCIIIAMAMYLIWITVLNTRELRRHERARVDDWSRRCALEQRLLDAKWPTFTDDTKEKP
jgi:hypothetical protein